MVDVLFRGDCNGNLAIWSVDKRIGVARSPPDSSNIPREQTSIPRDPARSPRGPFIPLDDAVDVPRMQPTQLKAFAEAWKKLDQPKSPFTSVFSESHLCCSLYFDNEYIVHGYSNGKVTVSFIFTICDEHLKTSSNYEQMSMLHLTYTPHPQLCLSGHVAKVTCLLRPSAAIPNGAHDWVVSGSADFSVCLWNKSSGKLIHKFSHQSGEV